VASLTWNGYMSLLLDQKCISCHGQAGGLSFDTYSAAMRGSRNGPVIVPGDADGSRIVTLQEAGDHPGQMSAEEIARLKQWIDLGAPEE
jgi:mono/diheme cytochrome c family protein